MKLLRGAWCAVPGARCCYKLFEAWGRAGGAGTAHRAPRGGQPHSLSSRHQLLPKLLLLLAVLVVLLCVVVLEVVLVQVVQVVLVVFVVLVILVILSVLAILDGPRGPR